MEIETKSNLTLESRKKLELTGILDVLSFDDERIVLNTKIGVLDIKGDSLKINKLDVQNGEVIIVGSINSIVYTDKNASKNKENLIKKLFQ
jgi:sporulation protein YabP